MFTRTLAAAMALLISLTLAACGSGNASAEPSAATNSPGPATQGASLDQAEKLIRADLIAAKPGFPADIPIKLTDRTTDEIRRRLQISVYDVSFPTTGADNQVFAIRDGKVIKLAGGAGVMFEQVEVTDLAGDGHPQLLYSYVVGSGIQTDNVCLLRSDAVAPTRVFGVTLEHVDLNKKDDQTVEITHVPWGGGIPGLQVVTIGILRNDKATGKAKVDLVANLPAEFVKAIGITQESPMPGGAGKAADHH